jgi:hypothetical protein
VTFSTSFTLYQQETLNRVQDGRCNHQQTIDVANRLKAIQHHIPDQPLDTIDLRSIRHKLTGGANGSNRPQRRPSLNQKAECQPVTLNTVESWLTTLGAVFNFLAIEKRWTPESQGCAATRNEHWRDHFNLTTAQKERLLSDEERHPDTTEDGKPAKKYTLPELTEIYAQALPFDRMLILFGVTLGWTQKDIATLHSRHLISRHNEIFIVKPRSKTHAQGDFWCCPELAQLITQYRSPEGILLRTINGKPLVANWTDNVKTHWDALQNNVQQGAQGVRRLPFKSLRKLAGQSSRRWDSYFLLVRTSSYL